MWFYHIVYLPLAHTKSQEIMEHCILLFPKVRPTHCWRSGAANVTLGGADFSSTSIVTGQLTD